MLYWLKSNHAVTVSVSDPLGADVLIPSSVFREAFELAPDYPKPSTVRYRNRGDHRVKVDVHLDATALLALVIDDVKGDWEMDERLFDLIFEPDVPE